MAELMGICGADEQATAAALGRMADNIARVGRLKVDRWQGDGIGLLRFHHGRVNPQPQPVTIRGGALTVAMDGELLEPGELCRSLRQGGCRIEHPECDAELAAHLLDAEGPDALHRLWGSWSLAAWDAPRRALLLAVDKSFSRPLYYCRRGDVLLFGSRFNALVASGALAGGRLDMSALFTFLTFDDLHDVRTFYREIEALPAGGYLRFEAGRLAVRRYWRLRYDVQPGSLDEHAERLADALRRAGRRATRGDLRLGLMLSGGVDSRMLLAASDAQPETFTLADSPDRGVRIAARIAAARGCRHTFIRCPPDLFLRIMDDAIELSGGMGSFHNDMFLSGIEQVAERCDVLFNEEPFDRLFKGYWWDRRFRFRGLRGSLPLYRRFTRGRVVEQILRMDAQSDYDLALWRLFRPPWRARYRTMMLASIRSQLADIGTDDAYHMAEHVGGQFMPGRNASFHNLACVRPYVAYRSMGLDDELRELAVRIPVRHRLGGRVFTRALRLLAPDLHRIPHADTALPIGAPAWLAWATGLGLKAASLLRLRAWPGQGPSRSSNSSRAALTRTPRFLRLTEQVLFDPRCIEPDLFDVANIRRLLEQHRSGRFNYAGPLINLLTFGRWFGRYGPRRV